MEPQIAPISKLSDTESQSSSTTSSSAARAMFHVEFSKQKLPKSLSKLNLIKPANSNPVITPPLFVGSSSSEDFDEGSEKSCKSWSPKTVEILKDKNNNDMVPPKGNMKELVLKLIASSANSGSGADGGGSGHSPAINSNVIDGKESKSLSLNNNNNNNDDFHLYRSQYERRRKPSIQINNVVTKQPSALPPVFSGFNASPRSKGPPTVEVEPYEDGCCLATCCGLC